MPVSRYFRWATPAAASIASPILAVADNADGTGGVATITGAAAGTTNVVYRAPWTGAFGSLTWLSSGSRTGNGTVALAVVTGLYLWVVVSTDPNTGASAISNVVYQGLTDATTVSVLDTILNETVTAVNSLGLSLGSTVLPVVLKKLPRNLADIDPASGQITVAGKVTIDELRWFTFTNTVNMTYRVTISVMVPSDYDFTAGLAAYTLWRQRLRTLFAKPGVYSSPVWDQNVDMGDFEERDMFMTGQDVQMLTINVVATEAGSP